MFIGYLVGDKTSQNKLAVYICLFETEINFSFFLQEN